MNPKDLLSNHFDVVYVPAEDSLLIRTIKDGELDEFPIRLRLETLQGMGPDKASEWVGQTLLLLIPTFREKLFKLGD